MEPSQKLKGVKQDKGHEDYTGSAPYGEGKSLRPVEMVLLRVSMSRGLNRYAWLSICSFLSCTAAGTSLYIERVTPCGSQSPGRLIPEPGSVS